MSDVRYCPEINSHPEPRVGWGAAWRLERLADGVFPLFPATPDTFWSPAERQERPLLVLGEEGAGHSEFIRWARRSAGAEHWSEVDFEQAESGDPVECLQRTLALGSGGVADALLDRVGGVGGPRVCLTHLERVPGAAGGRLLGQLRGAIERARAENNPSEARLVLVARDERAFEIEPYSAILDVVETCRLPRFTVEEIALLLLAWRDRQTGTMALAPDTARSLAAPLHRIGGGQPLLTTLLVRDVCSRSTPDAAALRAAFQRVKDSAPEHTIGAWQGRLARMVTRDERLRELSRDLTFGREYPRGDAPSVARSLCIAGWLSLGLDEAGQEVWRFSELHRRWAETVLRAPGRFLEGA